MTPYKNVAGTCLGLIILGTPCSCSHRPAPAFISNVLSLKTRSFDVGKYVQMTKETDDALFEAEDAAAVDAHDISDPGIEGAAMERAVMMAAEYAEQRPHKEINIESKPSNVEARSSDDGKDVQMTKETDEELLEAEDAAAVDAHDISDPGIEGAAMERAVMMAVEYAEQHPHKEINIESKPSKMKTTSSDAGKYVQMTKETDEELFEAEDAAAVDAHDISDPGIEGAAMERAVMMAAEYAEQHPHKEINIESKPSKVKTTPSDDGKDVQMTKETDEELFEAEDAAAVDAHDISDPGIEGAAMERAVMIAAEYAEQHPHKEIKIDG